MVDRNRVDCNRMDDMVSLSQPISEPLAVWSRRLCLFALAIVGVVLVSHRLVQVTTPVMLNVVAAGFAIAVLAVFLGLVASVSMIPASALLPN